MSVIKLNEPYIMNAGGLQITIRRQAKTTYSAFFEFDDGHIYIIYFKSFPEARRRVTALIQNDVKDIRRILEGSNGQI